MATSISLRPSVTLAALALGSLCAMHLQAQDILYYKLDEQGGKKAINYASSTGVAPQEGSLIGGNTPQYAAGRFGQSALAGGTAVSASTSTFIDTGWTPNLANSNFTLAFFMKQRTAPPSTSYFFYANSGFRMFTGGVAGKGLYFRNGTSGTTQDIILATDIQTLAASAWVHIALVIDATALTGTYYIDGVAQTPITLTTGATASGGTYTFRLGGFANSYGGLYDLDDYRVSMRAASAAEILAWSQQPSPADGKYGAGCGGASLASTGGLPQLGNATYVLQVTGANAGLCALGVGTNRLQLGTVPLPLDLGPLNPALNGCNWESSAEVFLTTGVSGGIANFPLPIPNQPVFNGYTLFNQALVATSTVDQSTNGFSVGIAQ